MARMSPTMNIMVRAAEKAARSLVRDFGEVEQLQVSTKGPGDFVTAADKRAEQIIHEELLKARPDYGFLMEESGEVKGKDTSHRWIIDPLDGTTNFLHGIPHWAISIGLEHNGDIIAGVIYDPIKDELFHAEKNNGAFMRNKRLRVSGRTDLMMSSIVTAGAPHRNPADMEQFFKEYQAILNICPGVRRFGSAALDLAYIAAGRYEAFWERKLKPWDIAAGVLIVREAGGFARDIDNDRSYVVETGNILATNDKVFQEIQKVLKTA